MWRSAVLLSDCRRPVPENFPTIAGLTVPPKSPANAKNANIAVPPCGHFWEERLIVPGHHNTNTESTNGTSGQSKNRDR